MKKASAKPGRKRRNPDFGAAIKSARENRGLTISEVAREADVSQSMLSRIEAGERKDVGVTRAARLCVVLGLSLDELFGL